MHGNGGGGATVSIHGLVIEDRFTHNPIFPNLFDRHDAGKGEQPVFRLQVEKKVEKISSDDGVQAKTQHTVSVDLETQPLQIVANYTLLPVLQTFLEFEGNDADFTETKMKAGNALRDVYDDYMIQMGAAMDELDTAQATEQRVSTRLSIGGLVLCLPQSFTMDDDEDPIVLVIDTGRITMQTDSSVVGDYDVSKVSTRGAEVYYCPTNTYFSQHKEVLHIWCKYDDDNSGRLSTEEMLALLNDLFETKLSQADLKAHIEAMDEDEPGEIEFDEFLDYYKARLYVEWLWKQADADKSGSLDKDELRDVLLLLGNRTTEAKYNKTWTALDTDKSGDISKQEFMEWWRLSGRFTGKKMVIVDSARVQGDISVCTKFDPHMTKMIGSFQLSSTEIQISDKEIQDLSLLGAAILSSIKRPEPDPTPKRVVDSKFVWKEEGEIGIASRALMGKTGYNDAFVEEPAAADPAKPKKPKKTKAEQAAVLRRAAKAAEAAKTMGVAPQHHVEKKAELTKVERMQTDLKQWKLMDVVIHVEDLHIALSMQDEEVMSIHLRGLSTHVVKRPLDQDVELGFDCFEIMDSEQVEHERTITHMLMVEDVRLNMRAAQAKSPYATDYVPLSIISVAVNRIDIGVRMGLLKELSEFGDAAGSYAAVLSMPDQATLDSAEVKVKAAFEVCDRALEAYNHSADTGDRSNLERLEDEHAAAEEKLRVMQQVEQKARRVLERSKVLAAAKAVSDAELAAAKPLEEEAIDRTKQMISFELQEMGLRLVPDHEEAAIVGNFWINGIVAKIGQELGDMKLATTIDSMVLMHGELPDTPGAVLADENLEKAILLWQHEGGCVALDLTKPSPRDTRKPPMVVKARISGFEFMLSAGFLQDAANWALHNSFMDAQKAKKASQPAQIEPAPEQPQAKPAPAEAAPDPNPVEFDATIEKVSILIPNESAATGVRIGLAKFTVKGSTGAVDAQDISLEGLTVWTYVGRHHHLRSAHKRNRHMVVAEPLYLQIAVRTSQEEMKRRVSLTYPGAFIIRISYCDLRLLKQLGEAMSNMVAEIKPPEEVGAFEPEPEPEPELEPEPEPEVELEGPKMKLELDIATPLRLSLEVYDDAVARNRANLLLAVSGLVQQMSISGPKIDLAVGLSVIHSDKHGVKSPMLEPLHVAVNLDSDAKTKKIAVENKVNLVVSELLLVDLQRVGAVWGNLIDDVEPPAATAADYESIQVINETGIAVAFGKPGSPPDIDLNDTEDAMLNSFEMDSRRHVAGKTHGHIEISDCRDPVGEVDELMFSVGAFGVHHEFTASTSMSTVRHFEKGDKKKKKDDMDIIVVGVERRGPVNVMHVSGTVSIRNALPVPVTVSMKSDKVTLFEPTSVAGVSQSCPTGTKRGMPLKVKHDDKSAQLTIERGAGSVSVGLAELLAEDEPHWLQVDDTWICLTVKLEQVRSRSANFTDGDQPSARTWVQTAAIDISPGVYIVNLVPEFALEVSYHTQTHPQEPVGTFTLDPADQDDPDTEIEPGQPTELLLNDLPDIHDDISIGVILVMHGVTYSTTEPCLLFSKQGSPRKRQAEQLTLGSGMAENLPLHLELLHDTLPSGTRVVRIWAAYCLVNSCGLPIMVCLDNHHKRHKDQDGAEDSLPAVRTIDPEKKDPSKVGDWISHRAGLKRDISLLPGADGEKLRIKVGHEEGSWSDPFRVDNPGTGGLVEIMCEKYGDSQLGVDTTSDNPGAAKTSIWLPGLQAAPPTKYVRLFPRTVIANHTGVAIYLAQASTKDEKKHEIIDDNLGTIQHDEMKVLEFPKLEKMGVQKSLAMRLSSEATWSGAVNCDTVQQVPVWLRDGPDGDILIRVTVRTIDNIMFVHIMPENKESPAFRLCNHIDSSVTIRQVDCDPKCVIPIGETHELAWDFPERPKHFTAEYTDYQGKNKVIEISPEAVGPHLADGVYVTVEGGTRIINFTSVEEKDAWKLTGAKEDEVEEGEPVKGAEMILMLVNGIGISLVSTVGQRCQEILAVDVGEIKIDITDDPMRQTMELTVASLQVDSMLVKSPDTPVIYPVILRAMTGLEEHGHTPKPAVSITTVTKKQPVAWAKHMEAVSILIQEIEVQVELGLLIPILEFASNIKTQLQLELPEYSEKAETSRLEFAEYAERNDMDEPILYMRFLQIHPISIKLSFQLGHIEIPPIVRPFAIIAKSLASIDQSPIKLTSIVINDACGYNSEITGKIGMHYAQQGKRQLYKIIGSIGILGDPVGLVSTIGSGITMFFYEPIQGIQQGPGHFIAGIGKGTAALVGGTVEGAFHAPSEVTAAVSQGLNALADTGSHAGSGQKAHSTMQGLGFLAYDFGSDLNKTVTSIFVAPVKGAQKDGANGFVKGLGKGVVQSGAGGAALGVDLATNLTGALGHLFTNPLGHPDPQKIRVRRVVHRGGVIEEWNEARAHGQDMLDTVRVHQQKHLKAMHKKRRANGPGLSNTEYYNDHFEVANHSILILADEHILLVTEKKRGFMDLSSRESMKGDKVEVVWSIRVDSIKNAAIINSEKFNGVVLTLDSLENCIEWNALELPIACLNAHDATQIHTLLEGLADAPPGEPWLIPVVGGHLAPDAARNDPSQSLANWRPGNFDDDIDSAGIERAKEAGQEGSKSKNAFACCGCGGRPAEEKRKPRKRGVADVALVASVGEQSKSSVEASPVPAAAGGKVTNFTRTITV